MAVVVFFTDIDEGHIYPTFGLAKSLKNVGHEIYYLGILDIKPLIESNDFKFIPIFEKDYPLGFIKEYKKLQKKHVKYFNRIIPRPHLQSIIRGDLDNVFDSLSPDLIIVNYALPIESLLLHLKYPYSLLFFTTWLRKIDASPYNVCNSIYDSLPIHQKIEIDKLLNCKIGNGTFREKSIFLNSITEFIPCPKELEFDNIIYNSPVIYIETGISNRIKSDNFLKRLNINKNKKILYVSLGSQTMLYLDWSKAFYEKFINLMKDEFGLKWHLIMSVGQELQIDDFGAIPDNVSLFNWVPQFEVLGKSDVAVIHGGLGGIKECILRKVPMLVFPMAHDQDDNANRVQNNHVGIKLDYRLIGDLNLKDIIVKLAHKHNIRNGLDTMNKKFIKMEKERPGFKFVEKMLAEK